MIGLLKDILATRPKNVRLLGMDLGSKTIGLALSDSAQGIATPFKTIQRTKFTKDIEELRPIIKDYEIGGYVLRQRLAGQKRFPLVLMLEPLFR